ncbi:MAG: hypothetical protein QM710_09935 [Flavobacterium sp.]
MKNIFASLFLFVIGTAFCQDIQCLKPEWYNPYTDPVALTENPGTENEVDHGSLKSNALQIVVLPNSFSDMPEWINSRLGIQKGFKVIVCNTSADSLNFVERESQRWAPVREVYYKNKWTAINPERHVAQCGNELRRNITLEAGGERVFLASCLQGSFVAKYRFMLYDPITKKQIYSNEFEGYFDPGIMELYKMSSR